MNDEIKKFEANIPDIISIRQISEYATKSTNRPTPPEKIQRREDGYDYVHGSYMDFAFKMDHPLYSYQIHSVQVLEKIGWVYITLTLTDRITGNIEPGAGAARIQVSAAAKKNGEVTPFDIIDFDKNIKSALTNAIKNAQSKFGVAADVYGKIEEVATQEHKETFERLILNVPVSKRELVRAKWKALKFDYTEFLEMLESKYPTKQETTTTKTELDKPKTKTKTGEANGIRPEQNGRESNSRTSVTEGTSW